MPRPTFWAASALAAALLAGCTGPMKSKVTEGIAFDCGGEGKAYVRFGDGGYLPGETALAKDNLHDSSSTAQPRARTTATLTFKDQKYDLIPEATQGGLRYRSDKPYGDQGYLIWSQGSAGEEEMAERWDTLGRPLTSEDARLGVRISQDPVREDEVAGEPLATCRRLGRDQGPTHTAPDHNAAQDHEASEDREEPHAR